MNEAPGYSVIAALIVGGLWQWARGPKTCPNWLLWIVFGLASCATFWLFVDPPAEWTQEAVRVYIGALVQWTFATLGFGTAVADVRLAPRTNSRE